MSTEAMVDAIVTRLSSLTADVRRMPDKPGRQHFRHPVAAIWVGYNGSRFDRPEALSHPVQMRRAQFDLGLLVRNLHGPKGAVAYIDDIRSALHGWVLPQGGAPVVMEREEYIDYENGVWRFDIVVATVMPSVPQVEDEVLPAFTEGTAESDWGDTTVPGGGE